MKPIQQPIEGAHPPKDDVPDAPATSAVAGEGKGEPDDGNAIAPQKPGDV